MSCTRSRFSLLVAGLSLASCLMLSGCYEDLDSSPPQAQTPAPPSADQSTAPQQGSSALGKAKSAAENIANRAEQQSQQVADEADRLMEDAEGETPRPQPE